MPTPSASEAEAPQGSSSVPQLSTDSWVIFVRSPVATYFRISRLVNTNHLTQEAGSSAPSGVCRSARTSFQSPSTSPRQRFLMLPKNNAPDPVGRAVTAPKDHNRRAAKTPSPKQPRPDHHHRPSATHPPTNTSTRSISHPQNTTTISHHHQTTRNHHLTSMTYLPSLPFHKPFARLPHTWPTASLSSESKQG